mmetsp:Transcript_14037/g.17019  ORF Transcript_14037/g.17019 Transcript_14037/m.17019 type:complete len:223 (-) Transcript_14037:375-1043(-)|eukprot:CAMPEP_0197851028 /NCGR_PEP_ID=MMETSP1438-20131217/17059_1 /TAXON_ID=1461541 /ORGANISM="Pterosperma sp., Strain CCMP1384" /LENGTH=222 /DNA_ID=CAMNT_0043464487 /DNA_START=171 /DNA_END=839 /DNA_ORIENTATION=+
MGRNHVVLAGVVILRALALSPVSCQEDSSLCSPGCKPLFIGDRNCDKECHTEECNWDGGDCDDEWEVRRTVVLGPFYKEVDHVEYHAVGPNGAKKQLSMQEGRRWEGIDSKTRDQRMNWKSLLENEDEDDLNDPGINDFEGRPPWYLNEEGIRIPAYRENEEGFKIAIKRDGTDMYDEDGNIVYFVTGKSFDRMLQEDEDTYYYYDDDDDDEGLATSDHSEL